MPSILFVTTVDSTLEAFLLPFAVHMQARGWRVDALANGATTNHHISDAFDQRFEIGWNRSPVSVRTINSCDRVRKVVSDGMYDLVWVHTPVAGFMTRYALRQRANGPAIIYTAHGFHFHSAGREPTNTLYRTIEWVAARWTDYIVTINRDDYNAARCFTTIAPESVRLIPGIGVDTELYAPRKMIEQEQPAGIRAELGVPDNAVLVTMVGEFIPRKRHLLALEALTLVTTPSVVLLMVGTGPLQQQAVKKAADLCLADRVRFAGYRRDIHAILSASDLLLVCSAHEGLLRSGLEAMASEVPIVSTPTRGAADLIIENETGWIAGSHSPADIARTIDAAASDRAERVRRGALARERAINEFSLDRILCEFDALFAEALSAKDACV